jgi:hypothetical protein
VVPIFRPELQIAHTQRVAVVAEQLFEAGAGHVGGLISISFEVTDALLPSTMFCLPDRAPWIIWWIVRPPLARNLRQKRKVRS